MRLRRFPKPIGYWPPLGSIPLGHEAHHAQLLMVYWDIISVSCCCCLLNAPDRVKPIITVVRVHFINSFGGH